MTRPYIKHQTDEERLAAKRASARKWYNENKGEQKRPTYAEYVATLTEDEYKAFRKRKTQLQKEYLKRKQTQK
jgi:hypothetical protein